MSGSIDNLTITDSDLDGSFMLVALPTGKLPYYKPLEEPLPYPIFSETSQLSFLSASKNCNANIMTLEKFQNCETVDEWNFLTSFMDVERRCLLPCACLPESDRVTYCNSNSLLHCPCFEIQPNPWFTSDYPSKIQGDRVPLKIKKQSYYLKPILDVNRLKMMRNCLQMTWALLSGGMLIMTVINWWNNCSVYRHTYVSQEPNQIKGYIEEQMSDSRWVLIEICLNVVSIFFVIIGEIKIYIEFEEAICFANKYNEIEEKLLASKRGIMLRPRGFNVKSSHINLSGNTSNAGLTKFF